MDDNLLMSIADVVQVALGIGLFVWLIMWTPRWLRRSRRNNLQLRDLD